MWAIVPSSSITMASLATVSTFQTRSALGKRTAHTGIDVISIVSGRSSPATSEANRTQPARSGLVSSPSTKLPIVPSSFPPNVTGYSTKKRTRVDESRCVPGCVKCAPPGLPGTRFLLPWARNPESELRRRLQAESVPDDGPSRILEELKQTLPVAMLFLKRLRTVEIKQAGRQVRSFQRVDHADSLIVTDGNRQNDQIWHVVREDFANAAEVLRARHPDRIEKKRSSKVTISMPAGAFSGGLFCACLPTEQRVGLPFHVNADFFTTNDRKSVILSDDYQSEWNREALRAAVACAGKGSRSIAGVAGGAPVLGAGVHSQRGRRCCGEGFRRPNARWILESR